MSTLLELLPDLSGLMVEIIIRKSFYVLASEYHFPASAYSFRHQLVKSTTATVNAKLLHLSIALLAQKCPKSRYMIGFPRRYMCLIISPKFEKSTLSTLQGKSVDPVAKLLI